MWIYITLSSAAVLGSCLFSFAILVLLMRHKHDFYPAAVSVESTALFGPATTRVLYKCEDCTEATVRSLPGRWTLADVAHGPNNVTPLLREVNES